MVPVTREQIERGAGGSGSDPVPPPPDANALAIVAAIDRLGDKLAHATVWAAIHAHGRGTAQVMADADIIADAYMARQKGASDGK